MEIALFILQMVLVAFGFIHQIAVHPDPCNFSDAASIITYDHASGVHLAARAVTGADRLALRRIDGIYDWVGYENGGFDRPELERHPIEILVLLHTGETRHVYLYDDFEEDSDIQWLWAFRTLTQSTDANGEHFGLHDICASGGWSEEAIASLISAESP